MEARTGSHPSADALQAFGLGKLDDTSAESIIQHLDTCADCRQAVAALSGDDFLQRLRRVQDRSSTPPPAKSLGAAVRAGKPAAGPNPDVPAELAKSGQYEVLRELGRGGMGVVYLARNKLMDRLEVLKVINKALLSRPGAVERFLREIRAAAKLTHANVVTAYSAVQQGELLAFAMEYIEGQDLASLVKAQGPLPVAHACFYAQQVAWGLQHAHEKQMVHRDIKPQNLMLARDGRKHVVKILDFGLARATRDNGGNATLTCVGQLVGTPDYISPEQAVDAARADIRADIYSLGCTLYYLLTGRPPFSANGVAGVLLAHQMDEAAPLNRVRPDVPEGLAKLVSKMMAKEPAKRFQTPSDVANALNAFVKAAAAPRSEAPIAILQAQPAGKDNNPATAMPLRVEATAAAPPKATVLKPLSPLACDTGAEPATKAVKQRNASKGPASTKGCNQRPLRNPLLIGGVLAGCLVSVAFAGFWAFSFGGGTPRVQTPDGIIVLKNVPPDADVTVDGRSVTVDAHDGKPIEIHVEPDKKHRLEVRHNGYTVREEELQLAAGERLPITLTMEPRAETPNPKSQPPKPPVDANDENAAARQSHEEAWRKSVAAMPAEKQIQAVAEKMRQLNAGFDGNVNGAIENAVVVGVRFPTDAVTDISPMRALPRLRSVDMGTPSKKGKLSDLTPLHDLSVNSLGLSGCGELRDLTPLRGLPLVSLDINSCAMVHDLTPLQGMKLDRLDCSNTKVRDLSPLKGMPLLLLACNRTMIASLSPLKGMKLVRLECFETQISDLAPVSGMPLVYIDCLGTHVSDLLPLSGMPLEFLRCGSTQVSDLSPLKGMPLRRLGLGNTKVRDLTPLKGAPLEILACWDTPVRDLTPLTGGTLRELLWNGIDLTRDGDTLRSLKSLKRINGQDAHEFLKDAQKLQSAM